MSNISSYPTRTFSETQKFFVLDPQTGNPSFVQGSDLVKQLTPNSNYVFSESTRTTAQATDYELGAVIHTGGATSTGDGQAGVYLVVPSGDGDLPMDNGLELLSLAGDDTLLERLALNTSGDGSDLIAHTGTSDTVTEALDKRVIYVDSIADLLAMPTSELVNGQQVQVKEYHVGTGIGGGTFVWDSDRSTEDHNGGTVIDPSQPFPSTWVDSEISNWFTPSLTGIGCFVATVTQEGLSVTSFGARPDFNFYGGHGTVNDLSFQQCIDAAGTLGSSRDGGRPIVFVPTGSYLLNHIEIPTYTNMGFGMTIMGGGGRTSLYFDEAYTEKEAIRCMMEAVSFENLSILGSITGHGVPPGRAYGVVAKKLSDSPDIDITFNNCSIRGWDTFAQVHGRGFVFTGGGVGGVGTLCEIVNDLYNTQGRINRTMRHYRLQGTRIDACGRLFTLSGSNTAEQVNHIHITGNDIISNSRAVVVQGDHTINGLAFNSNTCSNSYATAALLVHNIRNATIIGNVFMHRMDAVDLPTSNGECVGTIVSASGYARSVNISGNTIKNLRQTIIAVDGDSDAVSVGPNTLDECFSFNSAGAGGTLCRFNGARGRIVVRGNACSGVATTGPFLQTSIPASSMTKDVSIGSNPAPWDWDDLENIAYLDVYSGGNDVTSQIPNFSRQCVYSVDDGYVSGSVSLVLADVASGSITLSLPLAADNLTSASSIPGGGGRVIRPSGLSSVGYSLGDVLVNAATGKFELYKEKDLESVALDWDDAAVSGSITFTFRYKMG